MRAARDSHLTVARWVKEAFTLAGHFDSIGFETSDEAELAPYVERALQEGDQLEVLGADPGWGGRYVCWNPGQGVQLWVNVNERGEVQGVDPHYAGRGRAFITLDRSYDYDTAPPTGGVFAWVAVGTQEETKAGFDLPAFARFYDMACDYDGNALVQPTAFTHGAEVFESVAAYLALQEQVRKEAPELAFGVESFLPIGMFDPEGQIPPATARLSGIILEATRVTNPATGRAFHVMLVKTAGMTVDVVASDEQIEGAEPRPGGVVAGSFWLSAAPAEGPRRPNAPAQQATITISHVGDAPSDAPDDAGESAAVPKEG